jgi:hypothetical protein
MLHAIDADPHIFEPPHPYLTPSDWGHHGGRGRGGDPSGQLEVFANMGPRTDVSSTVIEKMLSTNPYRLYGLPVYGARAELTMRRCTRARIDENS